MIVKVKEDYYDYVLIDIVGCLYIDEELMDELVKVKEVVKLDEIFFVVDVMMG